MGCYTNYEIKIQTLGQEVISEQNLIDITNFLNEDYLDLSIDHSKNIITTIEETKWSNYNENLKNVSKLSPTYLFILNGDGLEPDGRWREYFFNGKSQYENAMISFNDFKISKLK